MRIKHILVTGMALVTLFGCGTNNNESMNDRNGNNIEKVRNQPTQRDAYENGINQYPGGPNGTWEDNQQGSFYDNNRLDQNDATNRTARERNNQRIQERDNGIEDRSDQDDDYRVADEIAEHVNKKIDAIDGAYVLTMGNNAYVACELDNDDNAGKDDDLSEKLEKKVTEAVKDADNEIENVYVSSNPDFVDLTSNYLRDIERGEPIEGFFDQFTEMIERVFPTRD